MTSQVSADDLESEITLTHQELIVKRALLNECREKLLNEIESHKETKSILTTNLNEKKELQIQLDVSLKAAQNLEVENSKIRKNLVKFEIQTEFYLTERQQLLNRCYNAELENGRLKNETTDLKERLERYGTMEESYKIKQRQTKKLVIEILRKQEILNKEQKRLKAACKESLNFASKVSEEADFQAKFLLEANLNRMKLEEELIQLMAAMKELRSQKESNPFIINEAENGRATYLEEWKICQKDSKARIKNLLEENKRLSEELNLATSKIDPSFHNKNQ